MMAGTSSCNDGESKAPAINGMLTNLYNVCATLIYRTLSDFRHTNIYVPPDLYFTTKLREIFQKTKLRHTTSVESRHWLRGPGMKYWPQQLNFAIFCATQGCGISRDIFENRINLPLQTVRAFYIFHVYFTIRRILYQLGGIQNMSALPEDPTFNPLNNHYDMASYKRICSEFGIDPSSDFHEKGKPRSGKRLRLCRPRHKKWIWISRI